MNPIICHCKMVYANEIKKFAKTHPSATFADLMQATTVSTGCGRCRNLAEQQFEKYRKTQPTNPQLSFDFEH